MYREISKFAPKINNSYSNDPLLYCTLDSLDSQFLHGPQGRIFGRYNKSCAEFMSDRCAANWDQVCEAMSKDKETRYPNTITPLSSLEDGKPPICLPYGEQLIRNSAFKKYRVKSLMCNVVCRPHDPTVPNSPIVCYETRYAGNSGPNNYEYVFGNSEGGVCDGVYKLTLEQIADLDNDPIMNHILDRPYLGKDLLEKIYQTMKRENTLYLLKNKRLGRFYEYLGHNIPNSDINIQKPTQIEIQLGNYDVTQNILPQNLSVSEQNIEPPKTRQPQIRYDNQQATVV